MKTKRTIKAVPNFSKRTFTLRISYNGRLTNKYRTYPMTPEEFDSELNNTERDWSQFLKTDNYYLVKMYF